jgi:hypothetical protein
MHEAANVAEGRDLMSLFRDKLRDTRPINVPSFVIAEKVPDFCRGRDFSGFQRPGSPRSFYHVFAMLPSIRCIFGLHTMGLHTGSFFGVLFNWISTNPSG